MSKAKSKSKEISTKELLKKVRKPLAPPSRIHQEATKYKRSKIRLPLDQQDS